ncbi:MAG: sigma 54-interacting transcriptional regulator, partial [Deferrisomatales bacterium]
MPVDAVVRELEWKTLYEVSRVIGQALALDQALDAILRTLAESLSMNRATVVLKDDDTGNLAIRASHGLTPEEVQRGVYRPGEGVTGKIFASGSPYVIPDVSKEPLFLNRTGARRIDRQRISFVGVPVLLKGEPIGVLNVDRLFGDEVSFERDVEFLTILATLIAQLVHLNRQVRSREQGLVRANQSLKAELSDKYQHFYMVGRSPAMAAVQELVRKVAPSRASVLLLGESGTGKTLIARILHEASPRARYPFVKVNCAALPENLLESELFGYEKGAFTGAVQAKPGRLEDADGGTLFLDEVGELSLSLQAKLLRFIQERQFERLGGSHTKTVDVRIVAATNRDLEEAVAEGAFREDLYYRLNVFPIRVPSLRDRRDDVTMLLDYFLDKFAREYGQPLRLAPRARRALTQYEWPGNVREMENMVERLAILAEGAEIGWENLPPHVAAARSPDPVRDGGRPLPHLKELERREVLAALQRNRWIQSRAARELGITLRQIGYRIKKYGLDPVVQEER